MAAPFAAPPAFVAPYSDSALQPAEDDDPGVGAGGPGPSPPLRRGRAFTVDDIRSFVRGKNVPPIVAKEGRRAFEVTYRAGQRGGGSSNCNFLIAPPGLFPSDEARVSFKLLFDDAFPWSPTPSMPKIGGKLGGFEIGVGDASGGNYSTTAASYRITFANEGGVLGYVYPQLRKAYDSHSKDSNKKKITWDQLDQSPEFKAISRIDLGVHVFMPPDGKGKLGNIRTRARKGAWNDVSMYVKLNTPGRYDGVLELTVNGATERTEAARLRYDDTKIQGWLLHTFFGGTQRPPRDTHTWYADFVFS
jgi:hypothetical protein